MNGHGEYIWKVLRNDTFTFPCQNSYRGQWIDGERTGLGAMMFGNDSGAKLAGYWERNFKHGRGVMICGNGKFVEGNPLFKYDKPCNIFYAPNADLMPNRSFYNLLKKIDQGNGICMNEETTIVDVNNCCLSSNFSVVQIENKFLELPIFTITEMVDLNYYIDKVLVKFHDNLMLSLSVFGKNSTCNNK